MKEICANNREHLLSILKKINISVPPICNGRKTEHCERWSICRLLATLASREKIDFPMQLIKRERPDFLLANDDRQIGIEITEAINPEYAKAKTLPEAKVDGAIIDPSLFKWKTPARPLKVLRSIISRQKLTGPGWDGSSVEIEYADAILDNIETKTKKLHSEGYGRFSENWLSIYCNLTLPALDIEEANLFFKEKAENYWSDSSFTRVFVDNGKAIIAYSSHGSEVIDIENLWNSG